MNSVYCKHSHAAITTYEKGRLCIALSLSFALSYRFPSWDKLEDILFLIQPQIAWSKCFDHQNIKEQEQEGLL